MPTLQALADRTRIAERIRALTPAHTPRWGRMDVARMLAHCADGLRNATGELPIPVHRVPFVRTRFAKWLIIDVLPMPKGAPTAPELLRSTAPAIDIERETLLNLLERFDASQAAVIPWAPHPLFGELTPAQWGRLAWKHLDHHLRQFGV
ncbi:MAG TPA: DUF1569 domain-containing protein [Gemmatimonadaceae bacterium]|nr:DUF1569 domain-containing protein [Gemmatimonadaceae bacterium]